MMSPCFARKGRGEKEVEEVEVRIFELGSAGKGQGEERGRESTA